MDYQPIDCNKYDEIILVIQIGEEVEIVLNEQFDGPKRIKSTILDIFTRTKEEFILLADGQMIRLDYLKMVGEIELSKNNSCKR